MQYQTTEQLQLRKYLHLMFWRRNSNSGLQYLQCSWDYSPRYFYLFHNQIKKKLFSGEDKVPRTLLSEATGYVKRKYENKKSLPSAGGQEKISRRTMRVTEDGEKLWLSSGSIETSRFNKHRLKTEDKAAAAAEDRCRLITWMWVIRFPKNCGRHVEMNQTPLGIIIHSHTPAPQTIPWERAGATPLVT